MPCMGPTPAEEAAFEVGKYGATELQITGRLACTYLKLLEKQGKPVPKYARKWWEHHKRQDTVRKEYIIEERRRKKARRAALSKLTFEERQALELE